MKVEIFAECKKCGRCLNYSFDKWGATLGGQNISETAVEALNKICICKQLQELEE